MLFRSFAYHGSQPTLPAIRSFVLNSEYGYVDARNIINKLATKAGPSTWVRTRASGADPLLDLDVRHAGLSTDGSLSGHTSSAIIPHPPRLAVAGNAPHHVKEKAVGQFSTKQFWELTCPEAMVRDDGVQPRELYMDGLHWVDGIYRSFRNRPQTWDNVKEWS